MSESNVVGIKKDDQEICFLKFSLKNINLAIAAFQLFCIGIGLIAFNRELTYELQDGVDWLVVWNGNLPTFCKNTSAPSDFPSIFKRFELEPYAKLGFKFALMYPATARVFFSYCRYQVFERQTPKINNKILSLIFKLPPLLLAAQLFFCSTMLIISFQLDYFDFPFYNIRLTEMFFISTGLYMIFFIISDIKQSSGIKKFFQTPFYLIRCLCAVVFYSSAYPTMKYLYTYSIPITCNHYSDEIYLAVMEYLTASSIFLFHFTELFELTNVYFCCIERKFE